MKRSHRAPALFFTAALAGLLTLLLRSQLRPTLDTLFVLLLLYPVARFGGLVILRRKYASRGGPAIVGGEKVQSRADVVRKEMDTVTAVAPFCACSIVANLLIKHQVFFEGVAAIVVAIAEHGAVRSFTRTANLN